MYCFSRLIIAHLAKSSINSRSFVSRRFSLNFACLSLKSLLLVTSFLIISISLIDGKGLQMGKFARCFWCVSKFCLERQILEGVPCTIPRLFLRQYLWRHFTSSLLWSASFAVVKFEKESNQFFDFSPLPGSILLCRYIAMYFKSHLSRPKSKNKKMKTYRGFNRSDSKTTNMAARPHVSTAGIDILFSGSCPYESKRCIWQW